MEGCRQCDGMATHHLGDFNSSLCTAGWRRVGVREEGGRGEGGMEEGGRIKGDGGN